MKKAIILLASLLGLTSFGAEASRTIVAGLGSPQQSSIPVGPTPLPLQLSTIPERINLYYNLDPRKVGPEKIQYYFPSGHNPQQSWIAFKVGPVRTGCGRPQDCSSEFNFVYASPSVDHYIYQAIRPYLDNEIELSFFVASVDNGVWAFSPFGNIRFKNGPHNPTTDCGTFKATMRVHPSTPTSGYVTDASGNPIYGSALNPLEHPMIWALEATGPVRGYHIKFEPGQIRGIEFDQDWPYLSRLSRTGASKENRVIIKGTLDAEGNRLSRFKHLGFGGGFTMGIRADNPNHSFSYLSFCDLVVEAGDAAFHIGSPAGNMWDITFKDLFFENVEIDGGFDHETSTDTNHSGGFGFNSKWGIQGYAIENMKIVKSTFHGLKREHAVYLHNLRGDFLFKDNHVKQVGRTAIQIVNRKTEQGFGPQPVNFGSIGIINNRIEDTGIALGDGCEGGQALTITGRNHGEIFIRRNIIAQGFNQTLNNNLNSRCPGGWELAGSLVLWVPGNDGITAPEAPGSIGPAWIQNNTFWYPPGRAHSNAMYVNGTVRADVRGNNIQTGVGLNRGLVVGGTTAAHPTPVTYCFDSNTINATPNHSMRLNGSLVPQPQGLVLPCP